MNNNLYCVGYCHLLPQTCYDHVAKWIQNFAISLMKCLFFLQNASFCLTFKGGVGRGADVREARVYRVGSKRFCPTVSFYLSVNIELVVECKPSRSAGKNPSVTVGPFIYNCYLSSRTFRRFALLPTK